MAADPSSALQEESQVLNICPPPKKKKYVWTGRCCWLMTLRVRRWCSVFTVVSCSFRCAPEDTDMESGADSTTHCVQSEGRSHVQSTPSLSIKYYLVVTSGCLCFRGDLSVWFPGAFSESGSAWWSGEQSGRRRRRHRTSARQWEKHQVR